MISPLKVLADTAVGLQKTYIANRTPTKIPFGRGVDYTSKWPCVSSTFFSAKDYKQTQGFP
ncbi:uncharacterized protein METZ01_LOCUS401198 [marine metagenome]|uniref:Uncharacterized protein n=1 Tax=marine metagenome TaxID=408172 RepID=A0A382VPJ5_9ZZZZ